MTPIGIIETTDGTTKSNTTTAVTFPVPSRVTVQPTVDVYVSVTSATATINDIYIPINSLVDLPVRGGTISMIPVSGTAAKLKVWAR